MNGSSSLFVNIIVLFIITLSFYIFSEKYGNGQGDETLSPLSNILAEFPLRLNCSKKKAPPAKDLQKVAFSCMKVVTDTLAERPM